MLFGLGVCGGGERWIERDDGLGVGGVWEGGVKGDFWVVSLYN